MTRILVLGSGGREHALCHKLAASPQVTELYCIPGNPGIQQIATCIPHLVEFVISHQIDLVVPGPEIPLVAGISDHMAKSGIACCGPSAAAARLESSKTYTKRLCSSLGIPTADWRAFGNAAAARAFIRTHAGPFVIKADGLAAGKGVILPTSASDALHAIDEMMEQGRFGEAGSDVLIEERLTGAEASIFALCDGNTAIPFGVARDYKRLSEDPASPNTGGMGAISPVGYVTPAIQAKVMDHIIRPTITEMARRGTPYHGILYAGIMLTNAGPKLIEYNVRFGDPECQVLMLRLKSDLVPLLQAAATGRLEGLEAVWEDQAAVAVVMASPGYPETPQTGETIRGLDEIATPVFHAGTAEVDGDLRSAGGRVLTVCATGDGVRAAAETAYAAIDRIDWPNAVYRRDIGRH